MSTYAFYFPMSMAIITWGASKLFAVPSAPSAPFRVGGARMSGKQPHIRPPTSSRTNVSMMAEATEKATEAQKQFANATERVLEENE